LHIEGTFEPEMMLVLARRNSIKLPYPSVDALRATYNFGNLLRDVDVKDAMATLDQALAYKDRIVAVGLDSADSGTHLAKFTVIFARARRASEPPALQARFRRESRASLRHPRTRALQCGSGSRRAEWVALQGGEKPRHLEAKGDPRVELR
jgi:adenosine deaminase